MLWSHLPDGTFVQQLVISYFACISTLSIVTLIV